MLTGTACYATSDAPAVGSYQVAGVSEINTSVVANATALFAPAPASPTTMTVSAPAVSIPESAETQSGIAKLDLQFGAGSPAWTATVIPALQNWLTVFPLAGTGNTTLNLSASAAGLSNGVYNAVLSIQAQDVLPQSIQVPVTFVVGASSNLSIGGIGNAASGAHTFAPGQLVAVYGSNLAAAEQIAGIQPLPLTMNGTSATVNGVAAPLWFVSPVQVNLQIPYETSAGPAVLGMNNGGQIASWQFSVTPTAPGIFASNGSLVPSATGQQGEEIVVFITGDGDVRPTLATGASPSPFLNLLEPAGIPPAADAHRRGRTGGDRVPWNRIGADWRHAGEFQHSIRCGNRRSTRCRDGRRRLKRACEPDGNGREPDVNQQPNATWFLVGRLP